MLNQTLDIGVLLSFRNPAQWRVPYPELYRDHIELAVRAEALGYDSIWLTEHHFADDGYSSALIPLAAAIAARTERVRIGFNLLLLPLHHPVRLAEDIAALDIVSNGRIDLGVGQGYAPHEFAGFGIDLGERLQRFREGLEIIAGLYENEQFSYDGKHYQVTAARLSPRPVQQPGPPLWIGATSEAGVRRAGRRGAHLLGLTNTYLQRIYETARSEAGLDVDSAKVLQLHWTHVADSDDEAWEQAAPHFHHLLSVYAGWIAAADDPGNSVPSLDIPAVEALRTSRPVIFDPVFGSTASVGTKLRALIAKVRTTHLCLGVLPGLDPKRIEQSLERFAREVAPGL